jgi:phage head maturation protease
MTTTTAPTSSSAPAVRTMPMHNRAAELVPATFNEADNSVDVVWTTGARVRRYDWWNDTPYEEELVVAPEAVDMSRFDAGTVQVLDGHQVNGGIAAIIGVATSARIENGQGTATLRLSTRPELAGIVADIRAGIIRSISFGYSVKRYEITRAQDRTDGVNMPLYRAVSWQPHEISFVTVPADAEASTREQPSNGAPCEFTRAPAQSATSTSQEISMEIQGQTTPGAAPQNAAPAIDATRAAHDAAAQQAATEAATRAADITELCARHGAPHLAAGMIRANNSVDQARAAVLEELARRDAAQGGHRNVQVVTVSDEHENRLRGIEEAIVHRIDTRSALTDNGRQYRGMSLLELGREFLQSRGVDTRGMDRLRLATEMMHFRSGMHSTSDFGSLFANVANKRLRNAYDDNPGTYAMWARRAPNAPDFKNISVVQLSGAPELLRTNEHGEFKYGTMKDGAETYAVVTYGRIVGLTRQSIINDDLRGFDRLVTAFGSSARRLENRTVYSQLTANAAMADGVALFHATHENLSTGAGSALALSALTTARAAMRKQKGLQSEELNLAPRFLIVPAALEQTAYQLTSSNYVPAKATDVNEFRTGGRTALEPIVEPILDAASAAAWYLASDSNQVDTVEYCYLDGAEGPVIETELGFEVDGISYKCRLDFAAKAVDHRGLHKGAGA